MNQGNDLRYELLEMPFSTADAENPELVFESGCLRGTFRNWQGQVVRLLFHDVAAFSWDSGDAALKADHRDDCTYVVQGSKWLQQHLEVESITPEEEHRHYMLCFNAIGVLQVLSSKLEVLA